MCLEELMAEWNAQADKYNQWEELGLDEIVAFAQQVEREACAKVCESIGDGDNDWIVTVGEACAIKIRERSNMK